ncbi:unnamed protein product [Adineta ricciae]|uniref:F-box domain-containing protein n=1 Tax=Adineta ricciae TaxID=249248 RepID=A0A814NLF7_ADIRI|nr:unnamed protein product [Adineta ricciae]
MSSFHTLPIDLVYRILDQIESTSIFLARVVCKRSDIIINSHHSYQTVTALELSHNVLGTDGAYYLATFSQNNKTIISLIYYFNGIHEQGAQYFGDVLRHNTTLTSLNIGSNNIDDDSIQHLANGLETNSVQYVLLIFQHHVDIQILTTLILCKNKFGHQGFEFLSIALRNNETLNTLDFRANRSFNDDAQYLTNALHANTVNFILCFYALFAS